MTETQLQQLGLPSHHAMQAADRLPVATFLDAVRVMMSHDSARIAHAELLERLMAYDDPQLLFRQCSNLLLCPTPSQAVMRVLMALFPETAS